MGSYDIFYFNCPHCGEQLETQSKAGYCNFSLYDLSNIPPAIAGDLHDNIGKCQICGAYYRIITQCLVNIVKIKESEAEE